MKKIIFKTVMLHKSWNFTEDKHEIKMRIKSESESEFKYKFKDKMAKMAVFI